MIGNVMNVALHECNSVTILGWMLWRWQLDERAPLMILTHPNGGGPLDNALRVSLSSMRTAMKNRHIRDYKRFGFTTKIGEWTTLENEHYDVLYIQRFVEGRHVMSETLVSMGFSFTGVNHGRN